MLPVYNTVLGRNLCVDGVIERRFGEFLIGWSSATVILSEDEMPDQVERLKGRRSLDRDVGRLFGSVKSYKGLVYLTSVFDLPAILFDAIRCAYGKGSELAPLSAEVTESDYW